MDHCRAEKKEKEKTNNEALLYGPRGVWGEAPYPIPEQETESLIAMKLSSLVHMTNFIPAIQTISRRACVPSWECVRA